MLGRRDFLKISTLAAAYPHSVAWAEPSGIIVNDIHSQLNATRVRRIAEPSTLDSLRNTLNTARRERRAVCIAGGRHSMGAQAFASDGVLIDTRKLNRVLAFDAERGLLEVESGMQWPQLFAELAAAQAGAARQWAIAQKQTGADRLTIGGCLSANVHGRGLTLPPFVDDVELGFNRWMQHTRNCISRRSVADEAKTKDLLHGKSEGADVGALARRRQPPSDCEPV